MERQREAHFTPDSSKSRQSEESQTELWRRLRDSSDAGVRVIETAFRDSTEPVGEWKDSPVFQTIRTEASQFRLHTKQILGIQVGKPRSHQTIKPVWTKQRYFIVLGPRQENND